MQPLYTVDHESRHSSNHTEPEQAEAVSSEDTPLLQRFPEYVHPRNPVTALIVSLLLLILIAGIIIGIYLLILQNDSENILPPVETPLQLVSRSQWDHSNATQYKRLPVFDLKQVMVVHTNTDQCSSTETCSKLLQEMQSNATAVNETIPYNFLMSSNGKTYYEALGWHRAMPMPTLQPSNGLVLAFIGNFSQVPPTWSQIEGAKKFFDFYVSQKHLHPSFRIIGKNVNDTPAYLSERLKSSFQQWNDQFLDA